jgi:hypothetical protein
MPAMPPGACVVTGPRNAERPCCFTLEYDCERRCQAELDLSGIHIRYTLGQMIAAADQAHVEAHAARWPQKVFRACDELLVRASVLEAVS